MNKQDEEKAREIIGCPCAMRVKDCEVCFNRISLLEMAQWKEEGLVEKVENFLRGIYLPYYANNSHIDRDNSELINDIKKAILLKEE